MKKLTLVFFTLSIGALFALFDSPTDKLYAAYQAKSRKKKEKAFQEGKKEIGNKKEQLKPLQDLAEKKGDFAVFKQAVKDSEKEKLSWIQKNPKLAMIIGCSGSVALVMASLWLGEKVFGYEISFEWQGY